jgi:urease accessory protein
MSELGMNRAPASLDAPLTLPALTAPALLAMLRLGSAALPIGAFAYSQALEQAVELGAIHDAASAERWIVGVSRCSLMTADVPLLIRLHAAWAHDDAALAARLGDRLFAMRPTRELRDEERQLGAALFRLLAHLGVTEARAEGRRERATLASAFARAAVHFGVPSEAAALSYAFAWSESQVGAATRLVPLGQNAAQSLLGRALEAVARDLPAALALADDEISSTAPGQAILSALHETQYSRLFRS